MKRFFTAFLALLLCGCSASPNFISKQTLYYPSADSAAPTQLMISLPVEGKDKTTEELLKVYFSQPGDGLITPFPADVTVSSLKLKETHATLVLSDAFGALSGIALTNACAAITKTIIGLTGVATVTIGCQSALLDGEQSLTFSEGSFIWIDEGIASQPTEASQIPTT